jgi:hypothetical protein
MTMWLLDLAVQQKLVLGTLVPVFRMSNVTVASDKVSITITISHSSSHAIFHVVLNVNYTEHHSLVISIPVSYLEGISFYLNVNHCK